MPSGNQQLNVAIKAVNEASRTLKDIQGDVGQLGETAEKSKGRLSGMGGALGGVAKIAGGFIVAQGLLQLPGVVSGITSRARDLELQADKALTVFADSLPEVQRWASEMGSAMGLSNREATNLATSMADLLKPMGFTAEQAATMSTETLNLAGALAEWSGGTRTAAEVAGTLQKAMLGETEELKGLGIAISAADISTRLLEKGQKDLTGAALQQAKALVVQELIFEKSTDAQDAFAEGAGSAARKQAEMQAAMANARDELSLALAPAMTKITELLATVVIPAFTKLTVWMTEELAPEIQRWIDEYGPTIQAFWEEHVQPALEAMLAIATEIVQFFHDHWPEIEAVARPILEQVILVIGTLVSTIANLISFVTNVFQGDWSAAWTDVKDIFLTQWAYVTGSLDNLKGLITGLWFPIWEAARTLGTKIADGVLLGVENLVSGIAGLAGDAGNALIDAMRWAWNSMVDWADRNFKIHISNPIGPDINFDPDLSWARLARGTPSFKGGLAWVGEEGPELVSLPPRSRVFSADQSRAIVNDGGGTVVNNYHFHGFVGDIAALERALDRRARRVVA